MRIIPPALALCLAGMAFAQDAQLDALHATLVTLRAHGTGATSETLGPDLAAAKHQLRDWIEGQLGSLKNFDGEQAFADRVNGALNGMGVREAAAGEDLLGALGNIRVSSESRLLIITTGVGIPCQYDESAYGYKLLNGHWQRIWESEQNDYSSKKYGPQLIFAVHVWQPVKEGREEGPPYIMTLGNEWGCSSAWHSVYYRVWRVDSAGSKLLIEDSKLAWLRSQTYALGSVARDWRRPSAPVDVLIEFTESSIDAGVHNREAIRHFLIDGDRVRRVDPVALGPRDFVDEWVAAAWKESAAWSASPALQQWHGRLHPDVAGDFIGTTMHCQTNDLWQVAIEPLNAQKNFDPEPNVYFLVRWRPPYHFTMMNVSDKPWPLCDHEDSEADEWRTLFPIQEWR